MRQTAAGARPEVFGFEQGLQIRGGFPPPTSFHGAITTRASSTQKSAQTGNGIGELSLREQTAWQPIPFPDGVKMNRSFGSTVILEKQPNGILNRSGRKVAKFFLFPDCFLSSRPSVLLFKNLRLKEFMKLSRSWARMSAYSATKASVAALLQVTVPRPHVPVVHFCPD